jgi:putative addiction module component (TIGR02574 family)
MIVEQYPELSGLSADEKLTLADELTHLAVSEEDGRLRTLVRERWAAYQADPEAVVPWEQLMAELLAPKPRA